MKILLTMNLPYTRAHGGANRANRGLCEGMVQEGHTVRVIVPVLAMPSPITREQVMADLAVQGVSVLSQDGVDIFTLGGVEIHAVVDPTHLRLYLVRQLAEFAPDWALVSTEDPSQTLLSAAIKGCPGRVIYLAHTPPLYPFGPESLYPGEARTDLVRQAAAVVPISKYAAGYIEQTSGIKATHINFPVFGSGPFHSLARFDNPYVLLMNACIVKGLPIFLALACAFPDVQFAALPGYGTTEADRADIAAQPNVTLLENRRDLDDIFRLTRILLMPSLWVESFGMAVVDAMLRGLPVLSANFGGLLEAKLGTDYLLPVKPIEKFAEQLGGNMLPVPIVPEQDITPWIDALRGLLTDQALYERQSKAAYHAATSFVSTLSARPFLELLNRLARESRSPQTASVPEPEKKPASTAPAGLEDLDNLTPMQHALLVRMLKKKAAGAESPAAHRITRCSREGKLPLSFSQQRLWFLDQLTPGQALYNMPNTFQLAGGLDIQALERAVREVINRHEVLRTNFTVLDGEPVQIIREIASFEISLTDLSSFEESGRHEEALRLARIETRTPFDLERQPPIRVKVLRLSAGEHVLVLTLHHIVSDGWSMGILVNEVKTLYGAFLSARTPDAVKISGEGGLLAELPVQYADFAVWQRGRLSGDVLQTERDFWTNTLAGAPNQIDLPWDNPSALGHAVHGAARTVLIGRAAAEALKSLCGRHNATLFAGLLAVLDAVLFRWTRQADLVVGTISANRNRGEIEGLIGCFMNFLPLRSTLTDEMSGDELVRLVRAHVTDAFAHQDFPFEKIVEAVNPERSSHRNPIYNVALMLQNFAGPVRFGDNLQAEHIQNENQPALLDLHFVAIEADTGVLLTCSYDAGLFEPTTIDLLLESFELVLAHLAARPEDRLDALPIAEGLTAQAAAVRERARERTLVVAATFTAEPIKESLAYWMRTLGLSARVEFAPYNQVFQQLLDPASLMAVNGYGANILLIRLEDWTDTERNTGDFIAALKSASARSQAPYLVCLCPPSPQALEEKGKLLARLGARLAAELAAISGIAVISSNELQRLYPVADYHDPHTEELGHIPYTPALYAAVGTAIVRNIHALTRPPFKVIVLDCDNTLWGGVVGEDGPGGIILDAPRMAFQQLMVARQQSGMLLCLCSKNEERDVLEVFDRRSEMPIKRDHLVGWRINWESKSSNLRALADELDLGLDSFIFIDDNPVECAQVRAECPEVLTLEFPQEPEEIANFIDHIWAFDLAKTTAEDSARTAMYRQNLERKSQMKAEPTLSDFMSGLEMQINIAPMSDDQLSRVSQLTERTNQFNITTIRRSEGDIRKLGRTAGWQCLTVTVKDRFGDYGLVGVVMFRVDSQRLAVDTFLLSCRALGRGVEHQMLAHVGQIAVEQRVSTVEVPFIPTAKNLPALNFLTSLTAASEEVSGQTRTSILTAEQAAATHYDPAAPSRAVIGDGAEPKKAAKRHGWSALFPRIAQDLSDVNKILDQIQSAAPVQSPATGEYAAPRTPTEEMLAGIWQAVLRLEEVGRGDNFFDLGGHSLLATQVASRIRNVFRIELPLQALFDAPTLSELAVRVEAMQRESDGVVAPPIIRCSREDSLPLSFAQQRMWIIDQMEPGNSVYNIPAAVRLTGQFNISALEQTFNEIVRRHEALRTTFRSIDGQPTQVIHPYEPFRLEVTSLEHLPADERDIEAQNLAQIEAERPFDLERGPVMRVGMLKLGDQEYVALLTMHHIVSDGWSMGLLIKEVAALYLAYAAGKPSPLPELQIQYADFAVWQRNWLQGETLAKQLSYWTGHLADLPTLQLPTDYPRPAVQSYRGADIGFGFPAEATRALKELSRREGATLFMSLLAAWQLLLSRYSGQTDIVVGSPIAGRNRAETEDLIGFFVNTLVLRADLSGNPSFTDLLRRVRGTSLAAYGHQDIPFEQLVETLAPERDLSRHPLFQVIFVLQNTSPGSLGTREAAFRPLEAELRTAKFDLTLNLVEMRDGMGGGIEYATDLFERSTIERMAGHLRNLLEGIAASPDTPVGFLPLLTAGERRQLLVEFNQDQMEFPADLCAHHGFERQAARTPDAVAVVFDNQVLTYSELNARANQLAHYLRKLGIGPEVCAGLLVERSPDMIIGLLGILKAGGAYVPLDPEYPAERVAYILVDSGVRVLLTQERFAGMLAGLRSTPLNPPLEQGGGKIGQREKTLLSPSCSEEGLEEVPNGVLTDTLAPPPYEGGGWGEVLCLDRDWPLISREPVSDPSSAVTSQNLAYVIYTSGSTGRPKGSLIPHENIMRLFDATERRFHFGPTDVWTLFHSIAFDFSVWEVWGPLLYGGALHIVPFLASRTPSDFWRMVVERQVTVLNQTPSAFRALQQVALEQQADNTALRTVIFGGEALDLSSLSDWDSHPGMAAISLVNMYGITETTVHVTYRALTTADIAEGAGSLIGTAIDDLSLYILDQHDELVPIGVPGELYVGGAGLARGYLNRSGLTAERFVPNPFASHPGERLYRTGDLVRRRAGGELEYLGRVDEQVKIRGFRIELGEIEASLAQHPSISATTVIVREDDPGDKRLAAYLVAKGDEPIAAPDLRAFLKTRLPDYMVPAAFVVLDALPLTPNGKVDRKALPEPERDISSSEADLPRTPMEEMLAEVWATILHVDFIGRQDNFFDLGGDSLLSLRVVAKCRGLGYMVTPKLMFQHQTLADLAAAMDSAANVQDRRGTEEPPARLGSRPPS